MIEDIRRRLQDYAYQELDSEGHPRAAVLVTLYPRDGDLHVILTLRTTLVQENKGQISFPGGAMELTDADMSVTALRESDEEIGLRSEHVKLIGRVDDFIMPGVGRFHISAFVGEIEETHSPYEWQPEAAEVAEILEVPLSHFLQPDNYIEYSFDRDGQTRRMPAVRFGEHIIWGATFEIMRRFLEVAVIDAAKPTATP